MLLLLSEIACTTKKELPPITANSGRQVQVFLYVLSICRLVICHFCNWFMVVIGKGSTFTFTGIAPRIEIWNQYYPEVGTLAHTLKLIVILERRKSLGWLVVLNNANWLPVMTLTLTVRESVGEKGNVGGWTDETMEQQWNGCIIRPRTF